MILARDRHSFTDYLLRGKRDLLVLPMEETKLQERLNSCLRYIDV